MKFLFNFFLFSPSHRIINDKLYTTQKWLSLLWREKKNLFCTFSVNIGKKRQTDYDGFRRKSAARKKKTTTYAIAWTSDSITETRFACVYAKRMLGYMPSRFERMILVNSRCNLFYRLDWCAKSSFFGENNLATSGQQHIVFFLCVCL